LRSSTSFNKGREILSRMFSLVNQLMDALPPELISESSRMSEMSKFPTYVQNLNERGCHVVVLGDAKVGKSSFLNYLLGEEILAAKAEACTSTITEIHYGEEDKIFTQASGQKEFIERKVDPSLGLKKTVEKYLASDLKDRDEVKFDRVKIYCRSPFLKSGIILVDAPGLNENTHFDDLTSECILCINNIAIQLVDYIIRYKNFYWCYLCHKL
jgi:ribosome biogenesis GTPase A